MIKKIKIKIKKNLEIFCLILALLITVTFTSYYNFNKQKIMNSYMDLLENVYFKKSINHLFNNLEPRFKKIEHVVNIGETFDKIMEQYSVNKFEIQQIKKELSKKIDINRLKLNQKFHFTVDQTSYLVKEFI
ncbi:peptidase M23, partial [Pelagibacterales bacterium SAG-MED12]|nr:peptidase M23 [Pelagibacterales bacterium SAG-MED12]